MRPRSFARPAVAGALCLVVTSTGAVASAQTPAATPTPDQAPTARTAADPKIGVRHRKLNVRAGDRTAVIGRVAPGAKGLIVSLQLRRGNRWKPIDRDRTDGSGRYALRERVARLGTTPLRVRVAAIPGVVRAESRRVGKLTVFRFAHASWYGPGLYGNTMACGGALSGGTLGVAHKYLPCGTKVTFKHRGRTVRVPVVDRGPYVGGREYDLTAATAQRLGFHGHGAILASR